LNAKNGSTASAALRSQGLNTSLLTERKRLDAERFHRADNATTTVAASHGHAEKDSPKSAFMAHLHREKRRSERYGAALSIVIYRFDGCDAGEIDRLLEALHETRRETDILGHLGGGAVAVLCPNTDERGVASFMRKIEAHTDDSCLSSLSATYPDQLFENLASGKPLHTSPLALEPAEREHPPRPGYGLKRGLDIVGAVAALILLSPVLLLTAAAIAFGSPGPVIFKQKRLGLGGVPFTFYKFRSMRTGADDRVHREFVTSLIKGEPRAEAPASTAARYKLRTDPRITPVGRLIRKTSVDELPQLFNVLKGDMSLVGPRPPLPYEAVNYQPWHLRRMLSVRPGVTGMWQVEGRSRVSFDEMVRMDLRYIRRCSLGLDLKILFKTVLVVMRCDGAV
jgi:lipopolysaccharide/colanic/teichoic acid biosynthesis glycosyltransferase